MKISVITVSYNSEKTIFHTIESFLTQDYADREMLIIDGASRDRTIEIVRSYESPLIRVYSKPDRGIYDAMNSGLQLYRGDCFGFLNSDDKFHDNASLGRIAKGLKVSSVVSGTLNFVRQHDGSAPTRIWHPKKFQKGAFGRGFSLPHPTTYARREVQQKVGNFDDSLRSAGDYDWFLRALEINDFDHSIVDGIIADMQVGGESTAGWQALRQNSRELLSVRQRWLGSGAIDAAVFLNLYQKIGQVFSARILRLLNRS